MCDERCAEDWIIGTSGMCVNATCICPDEYHGMDDFESYPTCHIHSSVQEAIYVTCIVLSLVVFLVVVKVLGAYVFRWNVFLIRRNTAKETASRSHCHSTSVNVSMNESFDIHIDPSKPAYGVATSAHITQLQFEKQKQKYQMRIYILSLWVLFSVSSVAYYTLVYKQQYRFTGNVASNFTAATSTAAAAVALWMLAFIWYQRLPAVEQYGDKKLDSILLRSPSFVTRAAQVQVTLGVIGLYLTAFILPLVDPTWREQCDIAFLGFILFLLITFVLFFLWLSLTLSHIFSVILTLAEDASGQFTLPRSVVDQLKRGISNTRILNCLLPVFGALAVTPSALAIFNEAVRMRMFLVIGIVDMAICLVALTSSIVFSYLLDSNLNFAMEDDI